jgi:hypothetical protein
MTEAAKKYGQMRMFLLGRHATTAAWTTAA